VLLSESIVTFLVGYFSTCRRSNKTKDAYRIDLTQFQNHFSGSELLESIDAVRLEEWARELTARQYAPTSIRRKFAALRVFYRYWVRKGELSSSPLWRIRLDLASDRQLPRTLTQTEMKRLIEHA
jgi:site-specific recombinase XerD